MRKSKRERADYHLYSECSDGMNTVEEVIDLAFQAGMRAIAITDHNYFTLTKKRTVVQDGDFIEVFPACEFSTSYTVPGNGKTVEVHVIGIWPNAVDPEQFLDILQAPVKGRMEYIKAMIEQLKLLGIEVSLEDVKREQKSTGYIGRQQLCDVLVREGYAESREEAMDRYVGNDSPYYINPVNYVSFYEFSQVVERIKQAKGYPVLCHVFYYNLEHSEMEALIKTFAEVCGGDGALEVFYERYLGEPEKMKFLQEMAEKYHLKASVASDRHLPDEHFATGGSTEDCRKMMEAIKRSAF